MAPGSSRDIYRTRPQRKSPLDGSPPSSRDELEWLRKSSGIRWSTGIFVLLILLFVAFLVAVIVYQQRRIRQGKASVSPPPRLSFTEKEMDLTSDPLQTEWDPEGSLVLEEWLEKGPAPIGEGPHPMTIQWIQEAALHLRRADAAYRAENWSMALKHFESANRIFPDIKGLPVQRGLCHLRLREFAEAETLFALERERGESSPGLLNNLAVAQMGQNRIEPAEQNLLTTIQEDPEYLPARHNLALLYYRTGNLSAAADAFKEVYLRQPLNSEHIHLYALTLLKLEKWKEAARVLRESIAMYPEAPPIRFRLAEALAHLPDPVAAVEALREAVALVDASHAMRWISRSEFDPLRDRPEFERLVAELSGALP